MKMTIQDSRLNNLEARQINGMAFVTKQIGEGSYEAAMYDRPKYIRQDSPVSRGAGKNEHEAKIDALIAWSRK